MNITYKICIQYQHLIKILSSYYYIKTDDHSIDQTIPRKAHLNKNINIKGHLLHCKRAYIGT